ncbi:MAG TPA: hypothetical protein VM121_05665 [Acidimicrobiales bacterium]|nr:hypothetical protein [Acidimicrobiales bacterium]
MAGTILKVIVAIAAFVLIMRLGMMILSSLARPNVPPPEGEMRPVNLRYRCTVCGTEVKMVSAAEELPAPPRHCQDDMELVAPPFE